MTLICCACSRKWPKDKCHVIALSEDEKTLLAGAGEKTQDTLAYCNPCWRVLSDRIMGAQYIKSAMQIQLRSQNVSNAEELSQTYFDRLMALTSKPKN